MLYKLIKLTTACASMLLLSMSGSAQTTGTLYFSSGATQTQLYRVDNPGTASVSATPIGSPYSTIYNGIGYYNGLLYGITLAGQVVSINQNTGAVTPLGISLPGGHNYASGDIANGILYTSNQDGGAGTHTLYRINIATGTYTSVPLDGQFADFAYYNGYLYGAAGAQGGYLAYRIDPSTGNTVQLDPGAMGPGAATWSDGTGMIYFDRKGTYNVNTGVATANASIGTTTAAVAGAGSGYDDATLAPASNTPLTNGGTIAANQTNCGPFDPAALTSTASASGGSGSGAIQYRWWANGALISGATSSTYDPGPITVTTTYQREANRAGTTGWVASNAVTATVENCSPLTSGGTIAADQANCGPFDPAALTSTTPASGGSGAGAIQYRWWANGTLISGATGITYDPGQITVTTTYQREANRTGTTGWVASNAVTATVENCSPLTSGGTIAANQAHCGPFDPAAFTSTTPASGGSGSGAIQYRWWANGTLISGATGITYDPGQITVNTTYQREANRVGTTGWVMSNSVTAAVDSCSTAMDFDVTLEQNGSSVLSVGGSLSVTAYVTNLTSASGPCSFTLSKPSPASGLTITLGTLPPGWTMTSTAGLYTFTSNGTNVDSYGSISLPITLNRTGGTSGSFTLSATITATNDSNPANNNAIIVVTKL